MIFLMQACDIFLCQKNACWQSCVLACLRACGSKCPGGAVVRLMGHLDCDATIFTIAVLADVCGGSAYLPHAVRIGDSCDLWMITCARAGAGNVSFTEVSGGRSHAKIFVSLKCIACV